MATPAQIRQAIDDRLAPLWTQIKSRQAIYLAAKGRYWQGIRTPLVKPVDGSESAPNLAVKPTDQAENWTGAGITLDATLPMTLIVDTYDGPLGKGFTATAEVTLNAKTWARIANQGPETWRAEPWRQLD